MHKKAVEQMAEDAKLRLGKAWAKVLPFGAQAVASAAGYTLGVTATQVRCESAVRTLLFMLCTKIQM
jgi:hypothetical protein